MCTFTKTVSHVHCLCVHNKRKKLLKKTFNFHLMGYAQVTWPQIGYIIRSRTTYQSCPNQIEKIGFFLCVHTAQKNEIYVTHIDKRNWILVCQVPWTCIPSQHDPLFWSFASLQPPLIGYRFPPSTFFALLVNKCLHSGLHQMSRRDFRNCSAEFLEFVRCGYGGNGLGQFVPCVCPVKAPEPCVYMRMPFEGYWVTLLSWEARHHGLCPYTQWFH